MECFGSSCARRPHQQRQGPGPVAFRNGRVSLLLPSPLVLVGVQTVKAFKYHVLSRGAARIILTGMQISRLTVSRTRTAPQQTQKDIETIEKLALTAGGADGAAGAATQRLSDSATQRVAGRRRQSA